MLDDGIFFGKCARCGTNSPAIELAGGYHSFLCQGCRNKFHSDCASSKEWEAFGEAFDRKAALELRLKSGTAGTATDVLYVQAGKALNEAEVVLCKWSEKWITGPRTAEETKKFEENKTFWERRADRR